MLVAWIQRREREMQRQAAAKRCGRPVRGREPRRDKAKHGAEKTTKQRKRQIRPKNGTSTLDLGLSPRIWHGLTESNHSGSGWLDRRRLGCGDSPPSPCASLPHRTRQESKGGRTESGGDRRE